MKKESLQKAKEEIIKVLYGSDINKVDKAELAINLFHFLDEKDYDENIRILKLKKENKNE